MNEIFYQFYCVKFVIEVEFTKYDGMSALYGSFFLIPQGSLRIAPLLRLAK